MKLLSKYIAFIFATTFLCTMFYQTFTVVHFYSNQAELTEKYCINKEKPELNCEGKCHLQKKLVKSEVNTDKNNTKSFRSCLLCFLSLPIISDLEFENDQLEKRVWYYEDVPTSSFSESPYTPPQVL